MAEARLALENQVASLVGRLGLCDSMNKVVDEAGPRQRPLRRLLISVMKRQIFLFLKQTNSMED